MFKLLFGTNFASDVSVSRYGRRVISYVFVSDIKIRILTTLKLGYSQGL